MSSSVITVNRKFPFSAPLDLATSEASQRQFGKQIVAFYHHCQKYAEIFTSHSHNKKILCKMDLSQRDVEWREVSEEKSILKTIKAISVTMWTNQYSARQEWTFSLTIDSHPSIETYTIDDQSIIPLKHLPFACLNGNEYETVRFPSANTSTFEDKEWDDWKEKMKPAATNYRTLLYPIFQLALQIKEPLSQERGILRQFIVQRENYTVLDVGGGDAELALPLLDTYPQIDSYTLIEGNQKSVNLAKQRQSCDCSFFSESRKKLQVIQGDITQIDLFETIDKKLVDVIILCGVVAHQVLPRSDSEILLQNCKRCLKDRGVVLIASHTPGHFSAADYERMGWQVLNKSFPYEVDPENGQYESEPFYVLSN